MGKALKSVITIMEEVSKYYPRMELGQLRVLLQVLEKPGTRAIELREATGQTKAAISRAVRVLASGPYKDDGNGEEKRGLGLITQITDPHDGRAQLLAPTRLGRRIADVIEQQIGD